MVRGRSQSFIGHSVETDRYDRAHRALLSMADYFRDLARARRRQPTDDLMSALVQAVDDAGRLGEEELVYNALYLLFRGVMKPLPISSAMASTTSAANQSNSINWPRIPRSHPVR